MAKSIRSKIKRKHRAEFRRTIGTEAHNKTMEKIQSNLRETVKKGSMQSFDKIADMLDTDAELMVDHEESTQFKSHKVATASGENKAPTKGGFRKTVKRKHKMRRSDDTSKKAASLSEKPKPRFFCEF